MPSEALARFAIWSPLEGLDLFMLSSFGLGSELDVTVVAAVVACEGAVEAAVFVDSDESVLLLEKFSLVGDLGVGSSRPPAESFVFFFLRRLPKVGMGAEKSGCGRAVGQVKRVGLHPIGRECEWRKVQTNTTDSAGGSRNWTETRLDKELGRVCNVKQVLLSGNGARAPDDKVAPITDCD